METILGLIGLGILCWFGYSLFKPAEAVYWHENPSRTKAFGYFLLGFFVLGSISPNSRDTETDESSSDTQAESTVSTESPDCESKEGVYAGKYTATTRGGRERGAAGLTLSADCSYTFHMDGSKMGEGQASRKSRGSFELENGNTVRITNNTARMEESGPNHRVKYRMQKVE
jgi:hypothetical protein